jgi:hypothetical protein
MSPYTAIRRGFARAELKKCDVIASALDAKKELQNVAAANIKHLMKLDFVHMRTEFREFTKELRQKPNREFLAMQSAGLEADTETWLTWKGPTVGEVLWHCTVVTDLMIRFEKTMLEHCEKEVRLLVDELL